jgi:hypothetical protein
MRNVGDMWLCRDGRVALADRIANHVSREPQMNNEDGVRPPEPVARRTSNRRSDLMRHNELGLAS